MCYNFAQFTERYTNRRKDEMILKLIVILGLVCAPCKAEAVKNVHRPIVQFSDGKVHGSVEVSRNGKTYYQFLGIPYGHVPQRFAISEPVTPWRGIKEAKKQGPMCMQLEPISSTVIGIEDCLVLNVFTRQISQTARLPVMVFIHGGSFVSGTGSGVSGSYIMNQQVVFVTINYRLGPLGFLNAELKGASGNQGLKDQVLALKWVQKNIAYFGGDPTRVLTFGQSAGGVSVSHLMLSPMSKGLFHAAASHSAVSICAEGDRQLDPIVEARKLGNLLNCPSKDLGVMVQCLRRSNVTELIKATRPTYPSHLFFDVYDVPQFGAGIEKFMDGPNDSTVLMFEEPLKVLLQGNFHKVPWLLGVNKEEGIAIGAQVIFQNDSMLRILNEEWGRIAPSLFLYYDKNFQDPCVISSKIRQFYFQNEWVRSSNAQKLIDLISDRYIIQCVRQAATLYSSFAPVYLYHFTHPVVSQGLDGNIVVSPPTHGSELLYFFNDTIVTPGPGIPHGSPEEQFSDNLIKVWASFARDGKPRDSWNPKVKWSRLKIERNRPLKWMTIDQDLQSHPENASITERMVFWDRLIFPSQIKLLTKPTK